MELFDVLLASALKGKSSGGSAADPSKPVKFFDYDGTLVHSYTPEEFAELSALPANPSHEGLTAQGWNWSLSDAKTYVAKYGALNVGQMYITSDGKTRIKIKLEEGRTQPVLGLGINGTVDVDWGDGTAHGTMTGSDVSTLVQLQHVYASAGEYTIALDVTGSISFLGTNTYSSRLMTKAGVTSSTAPESRTYQNAIQEIYIGSSVASIGDYAFYNCSSLTSITIPEGVTSIGTSAFGGCYILTSVTIPDSVTSIGNNALINCSTLASVTIPDSVTSIGTSAFGGCYILTSVTIPDSVTSIGNNALINCSTLASVTIPDSVTSIGTSAFGNCYALASIKFDGDTPPAVANSNAFSRLPTDCIIYVPLGSLAAYKSAANYPNPSVYTYVGY